MSLNESDTIAKLIDSAIRAYSGQAEGCLGLKARGSSEHAEAPRSVATLSRW